MKKQGMSSYISRSTKRFLFAAVCITGLAPAEAQLSNKHAFTVNDSIVTQYNRADYKSIYALTGPEYRRQSPEAALVADLRTYKKVTGQILSTEQTEDLGNIKHFKWVGEKAYLNFELWMDDSIIVRVKFNDFIKQPDWPAKPLLTNNPLKSPQDSIVHRYATIYMSSPKAVGLSIGIYNGGKKVIYNYGEVEKGSGKLPDDHTLYTLGSVTKTFIGILLAEAVLTHKLHLSDDIRQYLDGDFPNLQYNGSPVRLVDLATHTWGYGRWRINIFPPDYETMTPSQQEDYYDKYTTDSLYRDLHLAKIDTTPGSRYHYNIGSMLLIGIALEKVYHTTLDSLIRNYFGHTFAMPDTKLVADSQDIRRFAKGYNDKGELVPPLIKTTPSLYSIKTTTADMLQYVEANVEETNLAVALAHKVAWGDPKTFSLGLFWQVTESFGQGRWIKHSGYDGGSITLCSVHPNEKFGLTIWANDDSRQNNLFDLERNIRDAMLQRRLIKRGK